MTQQEALSILKTGANVFLTGEPGSGKTHTINQYVGYLREHHIEPAITASTGIAATHISGMTIHSWSGVGIRTKLDSYELDKLASNEYVAKRIGRTKVLIIDEVSMLSHTMLSMVDAICRAVKQNEEPFGGMQVILVGDFFQLPPVVKYDEVQSSLLDASNSNFAYGASVWERLKPMICYLTEQHRQDDEAFLSLLSAIRSDNVETMHYDSLTSRQIMPEDAPENTTKLFSHTLDVDQINTVELGKIDEKIKRFEMKNEGNPKLVAMLMKGCLSPEVLELKVGATVMCTKNNPKEGFVNGTLGTVTGFDTAGMPTIKTNTGRSITIEPMEWIIEENNKVKARITQIPLRLAWAITVHKSQGMSLDRAVMDLSQVFEFGQGYVALSRVRRLSGVYLLGINEHALKVHPDILEKDREFRTLSENATQAFAQILSADLQKMHENFIRASGGKIPKKPKKKMPQTDLAVRPPNTTYTELREKHPNAYRPWNEEQDAELTKLFTSGVKVPELMITFGRQRGGIRSRLVKLGLITE